MAFSASEAAFEGFRIARREPMSIAAWAVMQLLFGLTISAVMLPTMHNFMSLAAAAGSAPTPAPGTMSSTQMAVLSGMGSLYLVLLPLELAFFSVLTAAVYRSVLRPEDGGLGRLKLGADELRLAGLWVLMGLIYLALCFVVVLIVAVLAIGVVFATRSGGGDGSAAAAVGAVGVGIVILLLYLALLIGFFWVAVRLSLAGPMTFAQRKIRLFQSWKLTKGRFWSLFGCYLLAWIFGMLIGLVELVLVGALTVGLSGGSLMGAATAMMRPDFSSYAAYFNAARIVSLVVAAPFGAIFWALLAAPPAVAYKEIAGLRPEDQAEAFA